MLKKYDGTNWNTASYGKYFSGTEQFTNSPVVIRSLDQSVQAYTIKGNTSASGTPSSVEIDGVGVKTANLFDEETLEGYYNSSGTYINVTGQLCTKNKIAVNPNTEYWLGVPATNPLTFLAVSTYNSQGAFIERFVLPSYTGAGVQYTTNANTYFINVNFSTYYGGTYKNDVIICEGAQRSYQPYNKYEISIYNNGTALSPMYLNNPLRKSLDGTAFDTLDSTGLVTYNVDKYGAPLVTPTTQSVTAPTISTATSGTTVISFASQVQPSEVSLTYNGKHLNKSKKYNGNNWT